MSQAASSPTARASQSAAPDSRAVIDQLRRALVAGRNGDGGWGYYAGKTSRIEPTSWALLALAASDSAALDTAAASAWLARCQRPSGWLVEQTDWPVNVAFNALALFTVFDRADLLGGHERRRLLTAILSTKGEQAPAVQTTPQDNSLQGWPWLEHTFSWVEPTCWGVLALKKARGAGAVDAAIPARIAESERLLVDRSCEAGGWNFGNAEVLGQDLRPYVPTTALGLLAMQDRPLQGAVIRGLAYLEANWEQEVSATALSLSLVCLDVFGREVDRLLTRLTDHAPDAIRFGNFHGIAQALFALSSTGRPHAFRL